MSEVKLPFVGRVKVRDMVVGVVLFAVMTALPVIGDMLDGVFTMIRDKAKGVVGMVSSVGGAK